MKYRTKRRAVLAGLATAGVLASLGATAAPSSAQPLKPEPTVPSTAKVVPGLKGVSAAKDVHTGRPSGRFQALASQDGFCDVGDLCLYYLYSPTYGSGYDTAHNDQYLWDNHFIFAGAGRGSIVANNAEAYWNRDPSAYAYVCTGINYTGNCGWLAPNSFGNLNSTYADNVESLYWGNSAN